jgi:hypothetical protein
MFKVKIYLLLLRSNMEEQSYKNSYHGKYERDIFNLRWNRGINLNTK